MSELPCAACRLLHRRCSAECILAPYFPAENPHKFVVVHKVFGASHVVKMLQRVEETWREDAVKSLVYEAYARVRDPVHGCTIAIFYLQRCVEELQQQLNEARKCLLESQEQRKQLLCVLNRQSISVEEEMCCSFGTGLLDHSFFMNQPSP
ncbi:hypothetical protein HPP92_000511 [Vanilla planifolia]|uniref:LOB domain-containing protein n=1 Tax=Vanilla planifolia TaxID=51239 RepID=A0A835VG60_VANPL|nr:hypothetical protein HPP92_000511 [Vanilla planifolia]